MNGGSTMQTALAPVSTPRPMRWTRAQYYALASLGLFNGRRVQFIDGGIVEMPAMNAAHAEALERLPGLLAPRLGPGLRLRQQSPVTLGQASDPEPDAFVFHDGDRHPITGHPTRPLWVLEISDSTLEFDLGDKAALYSDAGLPHYWVLDLASRELHVFAEPTAAQIARHRSHRPGEAVALPWPAEPLLVDALLGEAS
jgi:Uma2 family endonuclease